VRLEVRTSFLHTAIDYVLGSVVLGELRNRIDARLESLDCRAHRNHVYYSISQKAFRSLERLRSAVLVHNVVYCARKQGRALEQNSCPVAVRSICTDWSGGRRCVQGRRPPDQSLLLAHHTIFDPRTCAQKTPRCCILCHLYLVA
jgi:hypothetical protein